MKALALVLTCVAFAGVARAADPVRVPGTTVSLVPPEGFTPSTRFPGFQNEKRHASIMITEIDAPVDSAKKGMTKEGLAPGGMTLLFSTTQKVNGQEGLLLHVSQAASGVPFLKWMLVVGDPAKTRLIVGTFPESDAKELGPAIQAAVLSATWTGAAPKDLLEGLPFRITPGSQLKLTNRVGNSLMFTESGEIPTKGPEEAVYFAGPSVGQADLSDLRAFSETRARQTAQTKEVGRLEGRLIEIGALKGYEIVYDAKDAESGAAIRLYQVIVPDPEGYYIFWGRAGASRASRFLPEFRRLTESFAKP